MNLLFCFAGAHSFCFTYQTLPLPMSFPAVTSLILSHILLMGVGMSKCVVLSGQLGLNHDRHSYILFLMFDTYLMNRLFTYTSLCYLQGRTNLQCFNFPRFVKYQNVRYQSKLSIFVLYPLHSPPLSKSCEESM